MKYFFLPVLMICCCFTLFAQQTEIKGFANVNIQYSDAADNISFYLGEQDLFITSDISDRISFLGETVFKYSAGSPTKFNVSIERIIIKYNFKGNHSLVFGKHHTPVSYWNDTYHHGRVFFPTVKRPMIFSEHVVELHTTGVGIQGFNLGKMNFGYQLMVGNGIGSGAFLDNDKHKAVTADVHIKPKQNMKIGLTGYYDNFNPSSTGHHAHAGHSEVRFQQMTNGLYFSWFHKKFELLTEGFLVINDNDSTGKSTNSAFYVYAAAKPFKKLVPYIRYDYANFASNEIYFDPFDKQTIAMGLRYEFNYLAVMKLEYNRHINEVLPATNEVYLQFAVGF